MVDPVPVKYNCPQKTFKIPRKFYLYKVVAYTFVVNIVTSLYLEVRVWQSADKFDNHSATKAPSFFREEHYTGVPVY